MSSSFPRRTTAFIGLCALGVVLSAPGAAHASPDLVQNRVDAVLVQFPGGTQIAANEIEWDRGKVVLTLSISEGENIVTAGTCSVGAYCAYSGYSFSGSKLTLWDCDTTTSTAPLGIVRSIENERSTGNVKAKNSANTVLATINHGATLGYAPSGIMKLTCTS